MHGLRQVREIRLVEAMGADQGNHIAQIVVAAGSEFELDQLG
jgi:hypothetical protein